MFRSHSSLNQPVECTPQLPWNRASTYRACSTSVASAAPPPRITSQRDLYRKLLYTTIDLGEHSWRIFVALSAAAARPAQRTIACICRDELRAPKTKILANTCISDSAQVSWKMMGSARMVRYTVLYTRARPVLPIAASPISSNITTLCSLVHSRV